MKNTYLKLFKSFFLLIIVMCTIYSCKKDTKIITPTPTPYVNISETWWKLSSTLLGNPTRINYFKFNSNNKFYYSENDDNPLVYFGKWNQTVNDIKIDFESNANLHFSGKLVSIDSMSGTMIDSSSLIPGVFSAKRYR